MIDGFDAVQHNLSWQPDWSNMWKPEPCDCAPGFYLSFIFIIKLQLHILVYFLTTILNCTVNKQHEITIVIACDAYLASTEIQTFFASTVKTRPA